MTALAIDTSLDACAVALHGEGLAMEHREIMERGHAERLPLMVRDVMAEAELGFDQLTRIAVTIGPGTFTGIRIGLAFARGLGLALDIPVIGFNTLEAIALGMAERPLVVVNRARDDEVYAQYFGGEKSFGPAVLTRAALADRVDARGARQVGDGLAGGKRCYPAVAAMAKRALAMTSTAPPEPLYLRQPDVKPQAGYAVRVFVRRAEAEEAVILAALHAGCFDDPWDARAFADLMATPGAAAWIALEAGEPIGLLLARAAADEAEILTIGVMPPHRRRGVAGDLFRVLTIYPRLFIEVAEGNTAARALYAREGFVEKGRRKAYYARAEGRREDALIMRRDIAP